MDWLRTKGLAKAAKKADRAAAEGLVAAKVSADGKTGVRRAERRDRLRVQERDVPDAAREVATVALGVDGDVDAVVAAKTAKGETVGDMVTEPDRHDRREHARAPHGRLSVARAPWRSTSTTRKPTTSARWACWWRWKAPATRPSCATWARDRAARGRHADPAAGADLDELDPAVVAKEREIQTQTAMESGKPREIAEKMVEGRIRKWMEEVVLLKQPFVMNPDQTIEQLVAETAKDSARRCGEGLRALRPGRGRGEEADDFAPKWPR
jgi:elongation factor Ts